mmetsp:Transcript_10966/g.20656  ORF Transcript_10966/g.20656 Transcript_10966/m.20656 type:complete len:374 (-) Transcript_10966:1076-2197(-)
MSPAALRRGVAFRRISTRSLSFVNSGNSKLADSLPTRALPNTALTAVLYSDVMNLSTRFLPITSFGANCVMVAALLFHSFTSPLLSIPMMGALALSISARRSLATRSSSPSAFLRSVMSWPTPTTPTMLPSASRRVVAFRSTSTRSLLLVKRGNSKLADSLPCSALSKTAFTAVLYSDVMKSSTRLRPSTSALAYLVISAALMFHSLTSPLLSNPKMGALAVLINTRRSSAMRSISASAFLRSVMSCPTPTTPTMLPTASRRVVAFRSTSTRVWFFVNSGNSKLAVTCPRRALSSTRFTDLRYFAVMNSSTRLRPNTSSLLYSVMSRAMLFHSFTNPSLSMPKMGALAVSINMRRSLATRSSSHSACLRSVMS